MGKLGGWWGWLCLPKLKHVIDLYQVTCFVLGDSKSDLHSEPIYGNNGQSPSMVQAIQLKVEGLSRTMAISFSVNTETQIVKCDYQSKTDKDAVSEPVRVAFDFAKVTKGELLKIAARQCKVDFAAKWRQLSDADRAKYHEHGQTISVRSMLDDGRKAKSKAEKVESLAKDASDEEKRAMIEALKASLEN